MNRRNRSWRPSGIAALALLGVTGLAAGAAAQAPAGKPNLLVIFDVGTHEEIKRLAAELGTTVGNTVTLAVRSLARRQLGSELASEALRDDEIAWLDADLR